MSISIDARKYLGYNYLIVREWDGYDKPSYTPIFKITEEEIDFIGGRFKRFEYGRLEHKFSIGVVKGLKIEKRIDWIHENATGVWSFDISTDTLDCYGGSNYQINGSDSQQFFDIVWLFYFKDEEDIVAFKLRWI